MKVDRSGLENFTKKVKSYSGLDQRFVNGIASEIVEQGRVIAQAKYGDKKVEVSTTPVVGGKGQIVATGKHIAYMEFGTGIEGEGTYPEDNLPKSGVPITGKWEYYYPSEFKDTVNGQKGWWTGAGHRQFVKGKAAGKQMYETSVELKEKMVEIAKQKIEGVNKNV